MAKNKELINSCRYYHGEASCPYRDDRLRLYWHWEQVYVRAGSTFEGESGLYKAYGGKSYPGIPFALLMVMFSSWGKSAYDMKASLPEFYSLVDDYLDNASDYFPINKIPNKKA